MVHTRMHQVYGMNVSKITRKKSVHGIEIAFTFIGIVIASRMIDVVMYLKMKELQ